MSVCVRSRLFVSKSFRAFALGSADFSTSRVVAVTPDIHDEFTQNLDKIREDRKRQQKEDDETEGIRSQILSAALLHVPAKGWTKDAIKAGAKDAGFQSVTAGIAGPNGGIDLLHFHTETSNDNLEAVMKSRVEEIRQSGDRLRIRPFIHEQVETRLKMNGPLNSRWKEALALQSCPENFPRSLHLDLELMDTIWYYAGDKAVDINWYTKRLSLLPIYKSTELAMSADKSPDFKDTWAFLDRRFEDEIEIAKMLGDVRSVPKTVMGVMETVWNMAGLRSR